MGSCYGAGRRRMPIYCALNAYILFTHDSDGAARGSGMKFVCGISVEVGWILTQVNGPDAGTESWD